MPRTVAGGRLLRFCTLRSADRQACAMWLWNGMPNDGRDTSGWLSSTRPRSGLDAYGDHLGIGGKLAHTGKLVFFHGDNGRHGRGRQERDPSLAMAARRARA